MSSRSSRLSPLADRFAADLKDEARRLGADLAGIAPAFAPQEASAYDAWVAAGMQGSMDYLARNAESRRDIRHWYPEAKSVLICGFNYAGNGHEPSQPGMGKVARYARLPDYHDELRQRLNRLLEWVRARRPSADGRVFVDTSPILERIYARYAGVAWIGKNTMAISPRHGSYFLLSGLALNVELPCDAPEPDHCGSCTRCLDACPTDAFPKERVLDASRCISYFTIERKTDVPEGFREGVGDWVFGCDICQEVCPWNRFAKEGAAFPPAGDVALNLEELAALDNPSFKQRFKGTPLLRTKRRGIVRNALLAMGNSGDPKHRATLERYAADPDPVLSEQARWSLGNLKTKDVS